MNHSSLTESLPDAADRQGAKPFRAFVISVCYGGFVSWLLTAIGVVVLSIFVSKDSAPLIFIPVTVFVWIVYCVMIILGFCFIPFLVLKAGRRFPSHSWSATVGLSTTFSVVICAATCYFLGLAEAGLVVLLGVLGCSAIAGAVSGHTFWKRIFPPMEDLSGIFQ
jgi:hypothetical protein